jgi:diguanylate cyclase (GGDEF)-like protein
VLLGEDRLEHAWRATHTRGRDQRRRLVWLALIAASYAVDALFLALFAAAGTVGWALPAAYAAAGAAACGGVWAATATGVNLRFRNPDLPALQVGLAVALQIATVYAAPQLAFPYLANLFTVFAFGMTSMPMRQSLAVWTAGMLALGALFYAVGERLGVPVAAPLERALVWLYFSVILGRCLGLGWQAGDLRRRLAKGRRKLAESLEQMRQLASHDELTRALNRRSLMAHLEQERSRAERGAEPFSVALLDLDHFKAINDTHGHAAGDEVLRAFALIAHGELRDADVFGRQGGEEFMLILAGTTPQAALPALERIRSAVEARDWDPLGSGLEVTVSAGIAGHRRGESVAQLLRRADEALYDAKGAGRNRVIVRD